MAPSSKRFFLAVFTFLGACHAQQNTARAAKAVDVGSCVIDPTAIVSDACASYSTLDALNEQLQPSIRSLTQTTDFFSYYRLNLYHKECPFWDDDSGICGNKACAVETIDNEEDIPAIWRAEELGKLEGPKAKHPSRVVQKQEKPLYGSLGDSVGESCVVEYDDECDERDYCVPEDESATAKGDYVSLVDNPERFTGYSGPSAQHVWESIYRENCFGGASPGNSVPAGRLPFPMLGQQGTAIQNLKSVITEHGKQKNLAAATPKNVFEDDLELDGQCLEKRVFFRVISGMHASISSHICWDYLNQTTGNWGPNLQCYTNRLEDHPDRVSNLYFNYALVLRALAKVRRVLENYTFCSGDTEQDRLTKSKVLAVANTIASGPKIYDESLMFQEPSMLGLKDDFRHRFRNVSRIMDCVGCDKCRLWGKLQTAGYGTALKILFEFDDNDLETNPPLRRTELVALVNTLDKISSSISAIKQFRKMLESNEKSSMTAEVPSAFTNNARTTADTLYNDDEWNDNTSAGKHGCSAWDSFRRELSAVTRSVKWVLKGYVEFPRALARIATIEATRLWNFWLGLPTFGKSWDLRRPPSHDEI